MRRLGPLLLLVACAARAQLIDVTEGTNLAVAASPDGASLVVDLLGGLWTIPVTGGVASELIPAGSGVAQPRFDPTGERIVFQRWDDGQWDLWQLRLADGRYEALTDTGYNEREPDYSPDGATVAFASDRSGAYRIWSLDLETGALLQLTDEGGNSRFPVYSDTGELAYVHHIGARSSLRRYAGNPRGAILIEGPNRLDAPSFRPGGGVMVFNQRSDGLESTLELFIDADPPVQRRLTEGEDVFVGRTAWLSPGEYLYASDGQLWRRSIGAAQRSPIHLFAVAAGPADAPYEPYAAALDQDGPYALLGINDIVDHPPTGRRAFTALGDLWLVDGETLRRLTDDAWTDAWPEFTPDGEWLIFSSDRREGMEVWRIRLSSGQLLQVSDEAGSVFTPRVSRDGRYVAFLETAGAGPWDSADLKYIELERPFRSEVLATALYDASELGWNDSNLRLRARDAASSEALMRVFVTPAGRGPAPDAGDELPAASAIPPMSWLAPTPDEPFVIRAGRLFDGFADTYAVDVDIHIKGQRIVAIVDRGERPLPARIVDASDRTIVPGLIDVHAHQSTILGAMPGRLWLRHGITTVREVGANLPRAIERAETWASGQQPGPRLVISPAEAFAAFELPADSPLLIQPPGRIGDALSHGLAWQMTRGGGSSWTFPPVLELAESNAAAFEVSTLGLSYQDILGRLAATGAWLPSGLAAIEATAPPMMVDGLVATAERVLRSNGRVAIGSDAPVVGFGSGFHRELELLASRGIPNSQILRWATAGGAIALGLSLETGTLEAGRIADLLIVDGDPLADIRELRRIESVVKAGVLIDIAEVSSAR